MLMIRSALPGLTGGLVLLMHAAVAAPPVVLLESDPRSSIVCTRNPPGTLTLSGATTSAMRVSDEGTFLYQAGFDAATQSGTLKKYTLAFDRNDDTIRQSPAIWDAADILTGVVANPPAASANIRHLYTSHVAEDGFLSTIPFVWEQLSALQKSLLNKSPISGKDDHLGEKRLAYLRGKRSDEDGKPGGIFRARSRLLGSIVNSDPVFVGAPSSGLQGAGYQAFLDENRKRLPAVFVGANDGALHAFDAISGEELFAYIPNALFSSLTYLTQAGSSYRAYVDGPITIAEARMGMHWRTVLVAGMGGGAQGVFALDVTHPEKFGREAGALWEFTDADDADIGNVVGMPAIAKFRIGIVKGVPEYRYFAIVAAGLNNYRKDGKFNPKAPAVLFLMALDKGKSEKWLVGVNYFKFTLPAGEDDSPSGLSAPVLVAGGDGTVSYAYAGDLQGNIWRFDFNGSMPWSGALGKKPFKPIFIAMDEDGNRQPVTQQPNVVFGPGGYVVLFGTGKYLERSDREAGAFKTQSFYGILDAQNDKEKVISRRQLTRRTLSVAAADTSLLEINGSEFKYGMPGPGEKGWYFDFIDSDKTGERSVSTARIVDSNLFFNTFIPNADACATASGRAYAVNTITGLPATANTTGYLANAAMLRAPLVVESISGEETERDATGKRRIRKRIDRLDGGAEGSKSDRISTNHKNVEQLRTAGRLSWREIINWVDLRVSSNGK